MSVDPNLQAIFTPHLKGQKPLTEEEMRRRVKRFLKLLLEKGPDATDVDER